MNRDRLIVVGIVAAAILAVLPRLAFLDVPFQRDEGAYTYVADVILDGGVPYRDAFDHKPPGIHYLYALSSMLFGRDVSSPRILAAVFVAIAAAATGLSVFRLGGGIAGGVSAALLLGISSASPAYQGQNANSELFTLPFLAGGVLLLSRPVIPWPRWLAAASLFGMATLVKPVAIAIGIPLLAARWIRAREHPRMLVKEAAAAGIGFVAPLVIAMAAFAAAAALGDMLTCVVEYNRAYGSGLRWDGAAHSLRVSMGAILRLDPATWVAALSGSIFTVVLGGGIQRRLVIVGAASSLFAVAAAGYFYAHYYVVMLPFLALPAGLGFGLLARRRPAAGIVAAGIAVAACAASLLPFLRMPHDRLLQTLHGDNPFFQSVAVGGFLRSEAPTGSTVFIMGSEAQILHYAGLRSPTRFFYLYPLMVESPARDAFREELLSDLQRSRPDFVLLVNTPRSTLFWPGIRDSFPLQLASVFSGYRWVGYSPFGSERVITDPSRFPPTDLPPPEASIFIYRRD